jgi:hypothetical protein
MPDCDQFARVVGTYGKASVSCLVQTLNTGIPMDDVVLAKAAESIWRESGGLQGLSPLLESFKQVELPFSSRQPIASNTTLDLVAERAVTRACFCGDQSRLEVTTRIANDVLFYHIIHARGGLLETVGADIVHSRSADIRRAIAPVAKAVGRALDLNPSVVELRISSRFINAPTCQSILVERLA